MSDSEVASSRTVNPYVVHFQLLLAPWTIHFKSATYIKEEMMERLDTKICKETLRRTVKDPDTRDAIGTSLIVWEELGQLFEAAIPSLEERSFAPHDPANDNYEGASGTLIASNYPTLRRDLERLDDLIQIARNSLSVGETAQNLAAKAQFDREIFKLINVCVKVTARGYDGESGTTDEDKWQLVVNIYKKLLIHCLHFLNNLVARNEKRKLMLWVELFDSSTDGVLATTHAPTDLSAMPNLWPRLDVSNGFPLLGGVKGLLGMPEFPEAGSSSGQELQLEKRNPPPQVSSPFLLYIGHHGLEVKKELLENGQKAGPNEIADECKRRWQALSPEDKKKWDHFYEEIVKQCEKDAKTSNAWQLFADVQSGKKNEDNVAALARSINQLQKEVDKLKQSVGSRNFDAEVQDDGDRTGAAKGTFPTVPSLKDVHSYIPVHADVLEPPPAGEADFRMTYSASYGADILQAGKDDLMKRLETYPERPPPQATQVQSPSSPVQSPVSPAPPPLSEPPPVEDLSEEEDSEDEDYINAGEDGRGLLTDVPLILGPSEIETLPMIIMSGIVPPTEGMAGYGSSTEEVTTIKNMHTVRCHLLLAQDNGRNLLRELLIFVAAWDLREEELYFKFMVKIMEAILMNGLMPFSYHAFRESKDIISPAQAVIMKLLTSIFKARQAQHQSQLPPVPNVSVSKPPVVYPQKVDVHMVSFLFTEFRRHIIPQTCALIFLQGQIRLGTAHPEDFPLNLWDMERMYEGVYQYLEFFAILTEHETWKNMMADWEISSELVTLLNELDNAIPKSRASIPHSTQQHLRRGFGSEVRPGQQHGTQSPSQQTPPPAPPVAVERPYDVNIGTTIPTSAGPIPAETFLPESGPYFDETQEEPSDFEWRNLKKLTVLVLSSLVWKSRRVQDQVRSHKGIEAILSCTKTDDYNPYIKEHAIMCLRFLLEGNPENQQVIHELEPRHQVPSEVLDRDPYETFMDSRGQVGLRRKGEGVRLADKSSTALIESALKAARKGQLERQDAEGHDVSDSSGRSRSLPKVGEGAPDLEALMQRVMRDFPKRSAGRDDPEKAEALKKLDQEFEKLDRDFKGR